MAQAPLPELTSPVIDTTGTLSPADIQHLSLQALQLQQEKGSQLQTLLIASTKPEDIAQYSQRAFEHWKLGREKADDGVLLVVAKEDRTVRIHVGYGLEGVIPDIVANRVINEYIVPNFRKGDYSRGVRDGAQALFELIRGAPLPPPPQQDAGVLGFAFFVLVLFVSNFGLLAVLLSAWASKKKGDKAEGSANTDNAAGNATGHVNDKRPAGIRAAWKKAALLQTSLCIGVVLCLWATGKASYVSAVVTLFALLMLEMFGLVLLLKKTGKAALGGSAWGMHSGGFRGGRGSSSHWSGGGGRSGGGGASGRW